VTYNKYCIYRTERNYWASDSAPLLPKAKGS